MLSRFRKSNKFQQDIERVLKNSNTPLPETMKLYSLTRWVGLFYEAESILPYKHALDGLKDDFSTSWTISYPDDFWLIVEELVNFLEPFKKMMTLTQQVMIDSIMYVYLRQNLRILLFTGSYTSGCFSSHF